MGETGKKKQQDNPVSAGTANSQALLNILLCQVMQAFFKGAPFCQTAA
jgi:hypothetical protein